MDSSSKNDLHAIEEFKKLGRADLHIHSNFSDGRPTIEEILEYVQNKTDLDIIAITDHNTIEGALLAKKIVKEKKYRFELIIGEEITSQEGHILGLFLTDPVPKGLPAHETINLIRKQDGVAVAAHPFEHTRLNQVGMETMNGVGFMTLIKEKHGFGGVEIVNATPTLADENVSAAFVNRTLIFQAETGSSDAHILEAIGMGYTLFEGKTSDDLRKAIKIHQTQAMHKKWTIMALIKYLFFFIPIGLRLLLNTAIHGRAPKQIDLINIPKEWMSGKHF